LGWLQCILFGVWASLYTLQRREIYGIIAIHTVWNLVYDWRIVGLGTGN